MKLNCRNEPQLAEETEHTRGFTDEELLEKIRTESDKTSFEALFRIYYKDLHFFAYSFLKEKESAEDTVQNVFLKIWSNHENWNPEGTVKSYLFHAVKNESLNLLRRKRLAIEKIELISTLVRERDNAEKEIEEEQNGEIELHLEKAINSLPERCRQIYLLNRRSGLTYDEIAEYLDISVNTVNTQMGRALQSLRNQLLRYMPVIVTSGTAGGFF